MNQINIFDTELLKEVYIPSPESHKGQNGKLLLIGGSHLFHAASLWALTIASRIVDMVFYSSVPENNEIVQQAKAEFRNGIVVKREHIDEYAEEADCILIGPGMLRSEYKMPNGKDHRMGAIYQISNILEIETLKDEGLQSRYLTQYLLAKYPHKKWVIDAGALQMMDPEWLRPLRDVVITPHPKEFERLFVLPATRDNVIAMAKEYGCTIVVKGKEDLISSPEASILVSGGNAGMTKGGTGDVLAGLIAALACNNSMWLSACAGSFFNKKAGESLEKQMGLYFNASDLALEIPKVMHQWLTHER